MRRGFAAVFGAVTAFSAFAAEPPGNPGGPAIAEALLDSGRVEEALHEATAAHRAEPGRAELAVLLGNIYIRKAQFQQAERYFGMALALDPECAEAYLGLGRLDQLQFRRKSARERFARAYSLRPQSAAVLRAYASVVTDAREEITLLERYLTIGGSEPREQLEAALGHLQFHRRLGERRVGVLASPYRTYRLRLESWSPRPGPAQGLLLAVRINGSKPLRLVFDTGAAGIFVHAKAARKLGLEFLSGAAAHGAGGAGKAEGARTLAAKVEIGDLELHNCVVDVTGRPVSPEADGAIGASVLQQFLVRLDAQSASLELVPYPEGPPPGLAPEHLWADHDRVPDRGGDHVIPVLQAGHLLLVNTTLGDGTAGYLVLDTGAAFTSISRPAAGAMVKPAKLALAGAGGALGPVDRAGPLRLRIGNHDVIEKDAITFDFRPVSNQEGLEISGLLGYPILSRSPLTIDYRDGLVAFDPAK